MRFDRNTEIKMKLCYFGFVFGFKIFSGIIPTITIRITFVIVDNSEAAI